MRAMDQEHDKGFDIVRSIANSNVQVSLDRLSSIQAARASHSDLSRALPHPCIATRHPYAKSGTRYEQAWCLEANCTVTAEGKGTYAIANVESSLTFDLALNVSSSLATVYLVSNSAAYVPCYVA